MSKKEIKVKKIVEAADGLSLGISIVVAVLIGVAMGIGLQRLTGAKWSIFIGVAIGIAAAINNIYKVYKKQKESLQELSKDPRYNKKLRSEDSER